MTSQAKEAINIAAKEIARRAQAKWGAGWGRISFDMKVDTIAAEIAYDVMGQSGQISVDTIEMIFTAAKSYSGMI